MTTLSISASQLRPGHEVVLTVMGGEEYVKVSSVTDTGERIRWRGYSSVMGNVGDVVHPEHAIRIASPS